MPWHPRAPLAWFDRGSLSTRVALLVAVIVTVVVSAVAYLEVRRFGRDIEGTLEQTARLVAGSAAESVGDRDLDVSDLRDGLHDLIDTDPAIDAISIIENASTGPRVVASTSTEERAEILQMARRAIATQSPILTRGDTVVMLVQPVPRRPGLAIGVTVGLESLLQAQQQSLGIVLGFALPTIAVVTLVVYVTIRRLVGDLSLRDAQLASSRTQLFAVRESLAHAERVAALGQMAATVAHQAGTPLNLVSGYVQMLLEDTRTDERTRTRLRTVDAQIAQVTRVLRTMLDRAQHQPQSELIRIADVIEQVREVSAPRLSRTNIRLVVDVDASVPPVKAHAAQLEMALLNLVTNALDAMPTGGVLRISATPVADGVRIEVADTGPGIPGAIAEHLFDPWVTTKPVGQGTGLGLAIVRDVVHAHNGRVSARSEGHGAIFVIDLPAHAPHPTVA